MKKYKTINIQNIISKNAGQLIDSKSLEQVLDNIEIDYCKDKEYDLFQIFPDIGIAILVKK